MPPIPEPSRAPVSSSEIAAGIDRLGVVGSVLYVAAHPDDENTRLLAWLQGDRHLSTAYMSLTRGDGGQNLIGAERGESLGLVRTFELLGARAIDGASQYFSRATDFGYSKSAEETLKTWPRAEVLGDLVQVIRLHAPDIIVTRFSTAPPNHGHHTASALLAREAFELAGDPKAYPEQLKTVPPHRARALFENKSHWRFKEGDDLSAYLNVDVGTTDPLTGKTFTEVAARSRSQHKSQGFGSAPTFGAQKEYFEVTAVASGATQPKSLLGDFDFSWKRFPKTETVIKALEALRAGFDIRAPAASVPRLLAYMDAVEALPAEGLVGHYRALKLQEAGSLIAASLGLILDATVAAPVVGIGESVDGKITAFARNAPPAGVALKLGAAMFAGTKGALANNILSPEVDAALAAVMAGGTKGAPAVDLLNLEVPIERPFKFTAELAPPQDFGTIIADPRAIPAATVEVVVGGHVLQFRLPLRYVVTDPVAGERRSELAIVTPVTVTPEVSEGTVLPSPNGASVAIRYHIEAHGAPRKGTIEFTVPTNFTISPRTLSFDLKEGEVQISEVTVKPSASAVGVISGVVKVSGDRPRSFAMTRLTRIQYDHLPTLWKLRLSEVTVAPFDFKPGPAKRIGYIAGAADEVAESLRRVGYSVEAFDPAASFDPRKDPINRFDAIVVGIRALNVNAGLELHVDRLLRWVEAGGNLIWQYNVSSRHRPLGEVRLGPAPLEIGSGRVTDAGAAMQAILDGKGRRHSVLETPNRLVDSDFEGWVQERGLYFAAKWQTPWRPVFRIADPDEEALEGALMVAPHGKGHVVYTGLGFFRQLPAGVPGAFRLFANLVSL